MKESKINEGEDVEELKLPLSLGDGKRAFSKKVSMNGIELISLTSNSPSKR